MLGYARGELPGHVSTWMSLVHPDDLPAALAERSRHLDGTSPTYRVEIRCRHKNGNWIWALASGEVIARAPDGTPMRIIGTMVDITTLKETTLSLKQACIAAEAGARAKSDFIAAMSHEIRTPMNGMMGMIELLRGSPLTAEQAGYAHIAHTSAESIVAIINDVLDLSKLEANMMVFESIPYDLHSLIYDIVELFRPQVAGRLLDLLVRIAPDVPTIAIGDPGRMRQVLMNLVGNAVKFTTAGHVLIETTSADGAVALRISDTGIGIPANQLSRLFTPFVQIASEHARQSGGSGLGLVISRRLTVGMGGTLTLTSELGRGSAVTVTIPQPVADAASPAAEPPKSLAGMCILVVDDSEVAAQISCEQIQHAGGRTATCSSDAAIGLIRAAQADSEPFAAVLIDARTVGMTALDLARLIRNSDDARAGGQTRAIALVQLTRSELRGEIALIEEAGFNGTLIKPARSENLSAVLAAAIARSRTGGPGLVTRHSVTTAKTEQRLTQVRTTASILVVEDNVVNQMVASAFLSKMGAAVTIANNGLEALDLIVQKRFQLVFMDCQIPEMDGYAATEHIRAMEFRTGAPRLPIIAMTAFAMRGSKERSLAAGMDDFIAKPIKVSQLEEVIRRWVLGKDDKRRSHDVPSGPTGHAILPPQPMLDPRQLREMDAITPGIASAILSVFRRDLELYLTIMGLDLESPDFAAVHHKAHKITGSCGSIGALSLQALAHDIELAGHAQDAMRCRALMAAMQLEGQRFLSSIRTDTLPNLFASIAS